MSQSVHQIGLHRAPSDAQVQPYRLAQLDQRIREADRSAAYERGVRDGLQQAQAQAAGALEAAVERLDEARELALDQLTSAAVELSVEIARQLVQVELRAGHYDLERIVRMSLAHSGLGRGSAIVQVNPGDAERLAQVTFRAGTEIVPNNALDAGDVHVESPNGLLVREVETALESIREQLLEDIA